jgi:hypothetical protein
MKKAPIWSALLRNSQFEEYSSNSSACQDHPGNGDHDPGGGFDHHSRAAILVEVSYSMRSAFMGSMLAARFAGIRAAKKEQIASETAAIVNAVGSQEETP